MPSREKSYLQKSGESTYVRKLSVKGQIVLPLELRKTLGIKTGDAVEFIQKAKNQWFIQKHTDINSFNRFIGFLKDKDLLGEIDSEEFFREARGLRTPEDYVSA